MSGACGQGRHRALGQEGEGLRPEELLEKVVDKDSFIAFVMALAAEREDAEKLEREDARYYRYGGAHNWQNSTISAFLYAGLASLDPKPFYRPESAPSWRMLAYFLYCGKIYE